MRPAEIYRPHVPPTPPIVLARGAGWTLTLHPVGAVRVEGSHSSRYSADTYRVLSVTSDGARVGRDFADAAAARTYFDERLALAAARAAADAATTPARLESQIAAALEDIATIERHGQRGRSGRLVGRSAHPELDDSAWPFSALDDDYRWSLTMRALRIEEATEAFSAAPADDFTPVAVAERRAELEMAAARATPAAAPSSWRGYGNSYRRAA